MGNPSWKGARSEAAVLAALVDLGKTVLMPWGGGQRYDFVLDEGHGKFIRVQCKTGVYQHGSVYFRTCSADKRRPMGDSYFDQIDAFAVYCPALRKSYLVPIEEVAASKRGALRVEVPANGQVAGIRWAHRYELVAAAAVQANDGTYLERDTESGRRDSNPRPQSWQDCALPLRHFREAPEGYHVWVRPEKVLAARSA